MVYLTTLFAEWLELMGCPLSIRFTRVFLLLQGGRPLREEKLCLGRIAATSPFSPIARNILIVSALER